MRSITLYHRILCRSRKFDVSGIEHSRHLEKLEIPASTLQLAYGDVSPYTEAAGSTGVVDSDSSCPIVMVCVVLDSYAVSLMYSLSPSLRMFIAAFMSRWCDAPQTGHTQ